MQSTYPIKRSVLYGVTNKLFVNIFNFMKTHLKFFLKLTCFLLVKGFFQNDRLQCETFIKLKKLKMAGVFLPTKNISQAPILYKHFSKNIYWWLAKSAPT